MSGHDFTQFGDWSPTSIPWIHDASRDVASSGAPGPVVESDPAPGPRLHGVESTHRRRASADDHVARRSADRPTETDEIDDIAPFDDTVQTTPDDDVDGKDTERNRDREIRRAISDDDRRDRASTRLIADRRRRERRARRGSPIGRRHRRGSDARTGDLDCPVERTDVRTAELLGLDDSGGWIDQYRRVDDLSTPADQSVRRARSLADCSHAVRRFASGPLHGIALAVYFVLTPYVVVTRWTAAAHRSDVTLIRSLLVALAVFWIIFVIQLVRDVGRLRHGVVLGLGGTAWLAGLIVAVLALGPSASASVPPIAPAHGAVATTVEHHSPRQRPHAANALGALPLALVAKRRRDQARFQQTPDDEIDDLIALLREADPSLVSHLRRVIGTRRDGVVRLARDFAYAAPLLDDEPVVACVLDDDGTEPLVSFAREGGRLRIPPNWTRGELVENMVGLHDGGRIVATDVDYDFLRALAIRSVRRHLVVYLGDGDQLDDALRACSVTIDRSRDVRTENHEATVSYTGFTEGEVPRDASDVFVELLRPDPLIHGLLEPFTASLRRRSIEMVAYITMHRGEAVSGDRLRTRVLVHADVDASVRTLANTATSVRRSLGTDAHGPRLHPVSADGLYRVHGVASDVGRFHELIRDARRRSIGDAAPLLIQALGLVHGEPLVGVRHGFEWFTVEGHLARLQRDGEWAALALHDASLAMGDVERAYWAIERGRLLDPFSDVLTDALTRVPRLRQFGGDRTGAA